MPIFDFKCTNPGCPLNEQPQEKLVRTAESVPDCDCGRSMEKLPLAYRHYGWHANHSSVRFHFNYLGGQL